jgi:hypothetical protein
MPQKVAADRLKRLGSALMFEFSSLNFVGH